MFIFILFFTSKDAEYSYFLQISVGAYIHPQNPVLTEGSRVNFSVEGGRSLTFILSLSRNILSLIKQIDYENRTRCPQEKSVTIRKKKNRKKRIEKKRKKETRKNISNKSNWLHNIET